MIHFFGNSSQTVFAVQSQSEFVNDDIQKLNWLFGNGHKIEQLILNDSFVGPRAAMITPENCLSGDFVNHSSFH